MLHYPIGFSTSSDGHWLSGIFDKEFIADIKVRGYDVTTLKFEVSPMAGNTKFRSQRPEDEGKPYDCRD